MKKILCVFLCAILLLGVLVSCGGTDEPDPAVTTTGAPDNNNPGSSNGSDTNENTESGSRSETAENSGTTASQPTSSAYVSKTTPTHEPENFGDAMGNPRDYTMLVRRTRWAYLHGNADSTATVQKAAYKRNLLLNEMYNINIEVVEDANGFDSAGMASFHTMLSTSTGEYDIAVPDYWWGIEYGGYFENIMRINEINEADPWWVQGWNDNMIINNRLFVAVGDAALELMEGIEVIFYNRSIEEEYDYDLYQTVKDGKWTIDEAIYMIDVFSDALNDNDKDNDVYGMFYDRHSVMTGLSTAGVDWLQTNRNNGIISIVANTARNINITDKLSELVHHTSTYFVDKTARGVDISPFLQGKVFMYAGCLYRGTEMKAANTVFDYGILVTPKYQEEDEYRATSYSVSMFAIPSTCGSVHVSAVVLDTMNWLSNTEEEGGMGEDRLVYTYYNTVLKGQVSNSPLDNEMLDFSREIAMYDFGYVATEAKLCSSFYGAVRDDVSVSTKIDSIVTVAETGLTDIIEFYNK